MFRSMRALFCCVFGASLILAFCVNVYITICLICMCLCGYLIKEFFLCIGAGFYLKAIKIWVFKFMKCIFFGG